MNEMFDQPIITLAAIILIPLVPTILLYSLFENMSEFRDVKRGIKLGGAVAFYFIILSAAFPMFKTFTNERKDYEVQIADLTKSVEDTVEYYQRLLDDKVEEHAQKMRDVRMSAETRLTLQAEAYEKRLQEEQQRLAALETRVSLLDGVRKSLGGVWRWTATSRVTEVSRVASSGEAPSGEPTMRTVTSNGEATFQRHPVTGEIVIWGTIDGREGLFRASEIILDHDRLIYLFEHQPSGTTGVSWLNFVKDGTEIKSMTGYWVLAGRDGKGTLSFFRTEKEAVAR